MINLELVASGLGYIKPFNKALLENEELLQYLKDNIISKVSTKNDFLSFLFNAYKEPRYGEYIKQYYKDSIYEIHADSGGLQAITLGEVIDETFKKKVYDVQSEYADIGMSFDEIPVITTAERSSAANLNDRTFDYYNLDGYIKRSADNFINQIRYYLEKGTECRPMYILHGNCYDTLMKWYDESMKIIPSDLKPYIGGIALTDSAMGNGFVEDVVQGYSILQISEEFKKFHLLGIGSIKRLIPYLIFIKRTGRDIHLSYDSTTLTQGVGFGRFYHNYEKINLSRAYSEKYYNLKKMISDNLHDISDLSDKEFFEIINSNSTYYYEGKDKKNPVDFQKQKDYYRVIFSYFFISVMNFMNDARMVAESNKKLHAASDRFGIRMEVQMIEHIDSVQMLNEFAARSSKKSAKLPTNKSGTLEQFFV